MKRSSGSWGRRAGLLLGAAVLTGTIGTASAYAQDPLQQIKSQFKTQAEYVKARDQAGLTDADVDRHTAVFDQAASELA